MKRKRPSAGRTGEEMLVRCHSSARIGMKRGEHAYPSPRHSDTSLVRPCNPPAPRSRTNTDIRGPSLPRGHLASPKMYNAIAPFPPAVSRVRREEADTAYLCLVLWDRLETGSVHISEHELRRSVCALVGHFLASFLSSDNDQLRKGDAPGTNERRVGGRVPSRLAATTSQPQHLLSAY